MIKRSNMTFTLATFSLMLTLTFLAFSVIANAATYYVATNGSNTVPYDTWAKAATSIQTAVNAASNDDIIIVGSSDGHGTGSYTENVTVDKQVTIQSENGNSTTTVQAANADLHVFEVTSSYVEIDGFSIYGATGGGRVGIYLDNVTNCTIQYNRCGWDGSHKNYYGIKLNSSSNCTINNNTVSYNSGEGIFLVSSSESNNLTSNIANYNGVDGISLDSSSNNTLDSNTVSNNTWDGIHIDSSSNNITLDSNTANDNGTSGILLDTSSNNDLTNNTTNSNGATTPGIHLRTSSNNTLENNTANSNKVGIQLESSSEGNTLTSNIVTHNEFGIFVHSSSNNTFISNTMNANDGRWDGDGIMLSGSDYNTISNNTANNDPGDGIEFYNSSHNTVMGNTLDNSDRTDQHLPTGISMRINYYSSYNTIINNTVIDGAGGIVLEEGSNHNFVSNNTLTGHTGKGFEFWENASYNTLTGNNISNNGTYGIWLASGNYNTIYLNDISNNTTSNIYSESSTTTWHSPTTIYYDYDDGTFHKGYLGNYYSDGTHTGSNGIGGTYTIANDNDDDYQLISTISNYSLQAWWLHSDDNMYRDEWNKAGGTVTISDGGTNIWIADQAALEDISLSGTDTWTGQLSFTSAPTNGHTFTVEIGSSTDGSDFTTGGPDATVTGGGSDSTITFATDASAFTVTTGKYLALRITSNDAEYGVRTGGAWSYCSSPENSTDYSLPVELSTFSGKNHNGGVLLEWRTESEYDNLGFILESSEDNKASWQEIASYKTHDALKGKINTSSRTEYSFIDNTVEAGQSYYYRLSDVSISGDVTTYPPLYIQLNALSEKTFMENAYPNPFNPLTYIAYHLAEETDLTITVFDMLGGSVKELYNGHQSAGSYQVYWNGTNENSMRASSGAYIIRMQTEVKTVIQKVILMK